MWATARWLSVIQAANMVLPLVGVPYLSRTLGVAGSGEVAAAQSFGMLAGLVAEYGLSLSGARLVANVRDRPALLRQTVADILAAQVLLGAAAAAIAISARAWAPVVGDRADLFLGGLVWVAPQVLSPQWFFLGTERPATLAAITLMGRVAGLAGVFCWVNSPADGARSLAIQGLAGLAAAGAAGSLMLRRSGVSYPAWAGIRRVIQSGAALFVYRAGTALQQNASALVLANFLPSATLGIWSGAERLARAAGSMMEPAVVALFSHAAQVERQATPEGRTGNAAASQLLATAGLILAAVLFAGAPMLTRLALGPGFEPAAPVLQVWCLWPMLNALSQNAGLSQLAARGQDRALNVITGGCGILQIAVLGAGAAAGLAPVWLAAVPVMALTLQWRLLTWAGTRSK